MICRVRSFSAFWIVAGTLAIIGLAACNGRSTGSSAAPQPQEDVELTGGMHVGDFEGPDVLQSGNNGPWRVFKPKPADARYQGIAPNPTGKYVWLSDTVHNTLVQMAMDGTQRVFSLKTGHGQLHPGYFAFGTDGNVYVGGCLNGSACNVIGILEPQGGSFRVVSVPSGDGPGQSHAFVLGPDGNVWFTEATHVGKITPTGAITEFAAPQFPSVNIVVGADHNLWFDGEGTTKCYVSGPSSASTHRAERCSSST